MQRHSALRLAILAALGLSLPTYAQTANEQSVEELRNTLVSVMEALVQKGLLTREQAQQIVSNAQTKAAADAKLKTEQEDAEKHAVVVTRIPETVKRDIAQQVSSELRPLVKEDVLADAKARKWGVPGAMPDWLSRIKLNGDIRFRLQHDNFADDNIPDAYTNYNVVNSAGGLTKAGPDGILNTTEDRLRARLRARLGLQAQIVDGISAGLRLSTGSLSDPVSPNQTLGQSGNRFQFAVDQAYLKYDLQGGSKIPWMTTTIGRFASPWLSTDLVWDPDFQFDGIASTWRYVLESDATVPRNVFLTLAALPLQEVELSSNDKWLYGAQLGVDLPWDGGGRAQLAGAYYYFDNITGKQNDIFNPTLYNYSAPQFLQKGNTLFDIDPRADSERYALAGKYHLLDVTAVLELPVLQHRVTLTGDYVRNLGFDQQEVLKNSGYASLDAVPERIRLAFDERTSGWQVELALGTSNTGKRGNWRASIAYKNLERDAVVDAFTDSDFHLGGTGAKGYTLRGDWWFRDRNSLSVRYISSDEIGRSKRSSVPVDPVTLEPSPTGSFVDFVDAPRFGVDTFMLDINASF